jgi:hypothetical protein
MLAAASSPSTIYFTGNSLFESICSGRDRPSCAVFAAGVYDGDSMARAQDQTRQVACPSPGATPYQLGDTVTKWLTDHPEKRDNAASFVVMVALREAFPCS